MIHDGRLETDLFPEFIYPRSQVRSSSIGVAEIVSGAGWMEYGIEMFGYE